MNIDVKEISKSLKKIACDSNLDINEVRLAVAMERVIARLQSDPELSKHLVFKGGFVLFKLHDIHRFTKDIDALGYNIDQEFITKRVPEALEKKLHDGFWFGDINSDVLEDQGMYGGLRFNFRFHIGELPKKEGKMKKLSRLNLDIGFGDIVEAEKEDLNFMLPFEKSISWLVYPTEFIYAEKLQTVIEHKDLNSRAKDLYDLVMLFKTIQDANKLKNAISKTFDQRKTNIPTSFEKTIKEIKPSLIEIAWDSIKVLIDKPDFQKTWLFFIEQMRELDRLFENDNKLKKV